MAKYLSMVLLALCVTSHATIYQAKDVVIENYNWVSELPKHRKIIVINHYGNIYARVRSEPQVGISASIQKIGPQAAIPSFDIKNNDSHTIITVIYPNGQLDQDGDFTGRVDVAVSAPETITVEMETSYGDIKSKKNFSNLTAKTVSGNIVLGSVGELNAQSISGNITLDLYNVNWQNPQVVQSEKGNINFTVGQQANIGVRAYSKNILHNLANYNIASKADKESFSFNLNQPRSAITLNAPQGKININIISKPHGGYVSWPSEFNDDIRSLPKAKPWKPGDPIIEMNDRSSRKKDQ
jgi:hypothetical protein